MLLLCNDCCTCTALVTIQVQGCNNLGLDGELVTIKQGGVTVATDTTAGGGFVEFDLPVGSYTAEVTAPTGFAAFTPESFDIEAGCEPVDLTLEMSVDSGDFACCWTGARPIPKDLYYTDDNGTWPMTYFETGTSRTWQACCSVAASNLWGLCPVVSPPLCTFYEDATVNYAVTIRCASSGPFGIAVRVTLEYTTVECRDVTQPSQPIIGCDLSPCETCIEGSFASGFGVTKTPTSSTVNWPTGYSGTWPSTSGVLCTVPTSHDVVPPVTGDFTIGP